MTREEKSLIIETLVGYIQATPNFYITDLETLNAEKTTILRRACFEKNIKLVVVKNTLLRIALEKCGITDAQMIATLVGNSAVMFSDVINAPAKLIKEFRKKADKPVLKAAYVQECIYIGDNMLDTLVALKSRTELIGDIIGLLQSPAKNVISALQASAGGKIAGLLKTLEDRAA